MIANIFEGFSHTVTEITLAIFPIILIFLVMQVFCLKMKKRQVLNILSGFLITYVGLILFMQGVSVAFLSVGSNTGVGQYLGEVIGSREDNWILVPIGFILGFVAAFAEPAVRIMIKQVEELSAGSIKGNHLLIAISLGVAIAVSLAMVRLLTGMSIWWFVIPGYLIAFILSRFVDQTFIAIAFDNGGVATGPMCATFVLSFCLGIANVIEGRDPILDGFGVVSLIALAPIIVTMVLGVLSEHKAAKVVKPKIKSPAEDFSPPIELPPVMPADLPTAEKITAPQTEPTPSAIELSSESHASLPEANQAAEIQEEPQSPEPKANSEASAASQDNEKLTETREESK